MFLFLSFLFIYSNVFELEFSQRKEKGRPESIVGGVIALYEVAMSCTSASQRVPPSTTRSGVLNAVRSELRCDSKTKQTGRNAS